MVSHKAESTKGTSSGTPPMPSATSSSPSPYARPLGALATASSDLQIRSEVDATLQSLLADVETSHSLASRLSDEGDERRLRDRLDAARDELLERRAYDAQRTKSFHDMGDALVGELWALSVKLGHLERWRADHGAKIEAYDALRTRLERSEEMVRSLQRTASLNRNAYTRVGPGLERASSKEEDEKLLADLRRQAMNGEGEERGKREIGGAPPADGFTDVGAGVDATEGEKDLVTLVEDAAGTAAEAPVDEEGKIEDNGEAEVDRGDVITNTDADRAVDSSIGAAGVTDEGPGGGEGGGDDIPPSLETIGTDEELLLEIFSFLDAMDVVNTACVSVEFYSRIDSLFGLGGGGGAGAAGDVPDSEAGDGGSVAATVATTATVASTAATSEQQQSGSGVGASKDDGSVASTATAPAAMAAPASAGGGVSAVAAAAAAAARNASAKKPAVVPAQPTVRTFRPMSPFGQRKQLVGGQQPGGTTAAANPLANVFSMLQPKQQQMQSHSRQNTDGSGEIATASGLADLSSSAAGSSAGGLSANRPIPSGAINSMAEKLSPSELAVIINMTERLRQKDREVQKITAEREDLAARLEGTEAVKEFLIGKVRDTERNLQRCQDDSVKILQQSSSDQEVIAFLDGRVKELERMHRDAAERCRKEEADHEAFRDKASKRQTVLEDMLRFERQQLSNQEKEWRATKKVLVKEVKHCRAQLLALQAERDSLRHKNMQLKQALLTMNGGGALGGSGGGSSGR